MAKKISSIDNTISLSQQVLDFYQLKQQPFSNKVLDTESLYTDTIFEQLLDNIKHQLQFTDLILFIEGDKGSGKSALFHRLLKTETDNILLLPLQAEGTDTLASLQQKMSPQLNSATTESPIQEQLKNLQLFDQYAALVVDDAHLLSNNCLCEILDFQKNLQKSSIQLKLLFFANTGMAARLGETSQLQASQFSIQSMPELTNKQVAAFIKHCFAQAGFDDNIGLSNEAIGSIQEKSRGNISQLMVHAVEQLEKHVRQQTQTPATQLFKKYLIPASLIIVLGIAFIAMQVIQSPPATPPEIASTEQAAIQLEAFETQVPVTEPEPVTSEPEDPVEMAAKPVSDVLPKETRNILSTEAPAKDKPQVETMVSTVEIPQQAQASPDTGLKTEDSPENKILNEATSLSFPSPVPPPPAIAATAPETINPAIKQLQQLGIHNSQWLAQQNPSHWTLQILGARDPATLLSFAKNHKLGEDTAWYRTQLKDKPWYVLVHRLYSNRDAARQSIRRLPPKLQKARPWAKSIKSIQQAMEK